MSKGDAVDTVVIGSGPGGLTAAVALARAGQRVVVLEQHYLPGGWSHSFSLEGYRFSPGVHYVGHVQPGGGLRRIYEGLGAGGDLEFCELPPDGFDHFIIDRQRVDQPAGLRRWIERLSATFPFERRGIERYFAVLESVVSDLKRCDTLLSFPDVLSIPFRAPNLVRWGFRTLDALLHDCVKSPLLRGILSAQCGNHGLAPSRVSLPLHAAMSSHYFDGAFYPRGGAKKMTAALIKSLRRAGGSIRTSARVERILVERGAAIGVELEGGERILASNVVCNADPSVAYGKLLPPELCTTERKKLARTQYSASTMSLFCAVDLDLVRAGFDAGNYWFYRHADVDGIYRRMERELPHETVDGLFLSITSLKDPGHMKNGHHTVEMFTFVPYGPFERWRGTPLAERGPSYEALKRDLAGKMLDAAEEIMPGIRKHLRFCEIGTPLTNDFYCETFRGAAYGTAKTPRQLGPFSFSQRGPIERLHLCGASTISHGIAGASMSGLVAAQHVLGLSSFEACLGPEDGSLRVVSAEEARAQVSGDVDVAA